MQNNIQTYMQNNMQNNMKTITIYEDDIIQAPNNIPKKLSDLTEEEKKILLVSFSLLEILILMYYSFNTLFMNLK